MKRERPWYGPPTGAVRLFAGNAAERLQPRAGLGTEPQQPVISPAKKVRLDRCGAATLGPYPVKAAIVPNQRATGRCPVAGSVAGRLANLLASLRPGWPSGVDRYPTHRPTALQLGRCSEICRSVQLVLHSPKVWIYL